MARLSGRFTVALLLKFYKYPTLPRLAFTSCLQQTTNFFLNTYCAQSEKVSLEVTKFCLHADRWAWYILTSVVKRKNILGLTWNRKKSKQLKWAYLKTCVQVPGKALEKPSDCVPHTFVPGANPSKQAAARQFDQAFTKLHKDKYDISVVWQYGTFFELEPISYLLPFIMFSWTPSLYELHSEQRHAYYCWGTKYFSVMRRTSEWKDVCSIEFTKSPK